MAEEEEVSYASVVFKTNKHSPPEAKKEESVYEEVKPADTNVSAGLLPDKKTNSRGRCYQQVACCFGILCVILLLGIIAVCVYKQHLCKLSEDENLRDHNNLTVQFDNLTQAYTVLKSKITNLIAENQNLKSQNEKLETQNQDLETRRNNLTEQIGNMETKRNEVDVSQAQWSIDAYCPKQNKNRQCKACQDGWTLSQSNCYVINDAVSGQKTWEEARENCRGKISDLVVIVDQTEKTFITDKSSGIKGYWIGLRAEDGKWKWLNGSVLTENSWIQQPPTNGQCVISVQTEGWKSVSCGDRNRWICKKKALSV